MDQVETIAPKNGLPSVLSVGEIARRSGIAVSTVHFYERKGLIEGWRSSGNQRRYPRAVLRRIAVIRIGQAAGISLAVIKAFLDKMSADRVLSKEDWNTLSSEWKLMLEQRIAGLVHLRDRLETCIGCGCLSLAECPLRNADDHLGRSGPGPRLLD